MRISDTHHTARFVCTTDSTGAQIASFYAGAMSEARLIELAPIVDRVGAPSYVLVGADDPDGDAPAHRGVPRSAATRSSPTPASSWPSATGELIRNLIDGAAILFSNEYESHMIEQKTGWSADEVLAGSASRSPRSARTACGSQRSGEEPIERARRRGREAVEPTGVGDAFRAGFLAALAWGLGLERAAQVGLRARGVRRGDGRHAGVHVHRRASSSAGWTTSYGGEAAEVVRPHLTRRSG